MTRQESAEQRTKSKRGRKKGLLLLSPARDIIDRCGGDEIVAKLTGRSVTRVRRWTLPRERGGSDGLIPICAARRISAHLGIPIDKVISDKGVLPRSDLAVLSHLICGHDALSIAASLQILPEEVAAARHRLQQAATVNPAIWDAIDAQRAGAA